MLTGHATQSVSSSWLLSSPVRIRNFPAAHIILQEPVEPPEPVHLPGKHMRHSSKLVYGAAGLETAYRPAGQSSQSSTLSGSITPGWNLPTGHVSQAGCSCSDVRVSVNYSSEPKHKQYNEKDRCPDCNVVVHHTYTLSYLPVLLVSCSYHPPGHCWQLRI